MVDKTLEKKHPVHTCPFTEANPLHAQDALGGGACQSPKADACRRGDGLVEQLTLHGTPISMVTASCSQLRPLPTIPLLNT